MPCAQQHVFIKPFRVGESVLFYYLEGNIALVDANLAVVDCGGVGFECATTRFTLSQLKVGQRQRLYTYCSVREDAFDVFGFATRDELRCFELLLSVTGVGPKAALAILSATTPDGFRLAVLTGDEKTLIAAPGIGKKIAQRILLELKDKIAGTQNEFSTAGPRVSLPQTGGRMDEALAALSALGYSGAESAQALRGADAEKMSVEELVRYALRAMVMP